MAVTATEIKRAYNELLGRSPSDADLKHHGQWENEAQLRSVIEESAEFKATGNLERLIRTRYPDYAFLLNNPEIRGILLRAVHPDTEMDEQTFASAIRGTNWWRTTNAAQREYATLQSLNPGELERRVQEKTFHAQRIAARIGATQTEAQLRSHANHALYMGWSDDELTDYLFNFVPGQGEGGGATYATVQQIRQMAKDYMVTATPEVLSQAVAVTRGTTSPEAIQRQLATMAKAKFAGNQQLAELIDAGITPSAFFSEHKRLIANELEMDEDAVDLSASDWMPVISHADGGAVRPMTLSETRKLVRSDAKYGWENTRTGRATITEMAQGLLQQMGIRAGSN